MPKKKEPYKILGVFSLNPIELLHYFVLVGAVIGAFAMVGVHVLYTPIQNAVLLFFTVYVVDSVLHKMMGG